MLQQEIVCVVEHCVAAWATVQDVLLEVGRATTTAVVAAIRRRQLVKNMVSILGWWS